MSVLRGDALSVDPTTRVWEHIYSRASGYGERIAQVDAETGRVLTFRQLVTRSKRICLCLAAHGVSRGDVVAICSENNLEYSCALLGALEAGAACVLLNPLYTPRELEHALSIVKPKIALCSGSVAKGKPIEVFSDSSVVKSVFVWGCKKETLPNKCRKLEDLLEAEYSPIVTRIHGESEYLYTQQFRKEQNIALILSSSGSTGLPKGVMLTHANIVAALSTSPHYIQKFAVALGLMPFFHAYGLILMLMCLCEGAEIVVMGKFAVDVFIKTIKVYQISCLYLVPSLLVLLAKRKATSSEDFNSVKHIWTGAASVSSKVQQLIYEQLPPAGSLHHSYGLTETTFTMFTCSYLPSKAGSAGRLTPGMMCKVVDLKTRKVLGPNQEGELCFKGHLLMAGYMGNIEATRETIDSDGWLHSGDLGYYDNDHYFFIVDRLKELIKYQGHQVSPSELESILLTHTAIQDVAVVGIPHEVFGELPQAHVVRQPGIDVSAEEIQHFLASKVSPHKRLHGGVKFVESIPKTASGKIQRAELKKHVL